MTTRDFAYEDYKRGMKYKDIADKHGVSLSAVKSWAVRYWKKEAAAGEGKPPGQACPDPKLQAGALQRELDEVDANDALTERERLFCLYYCRTFNATASYQKAYSAAYNTANAAGYKLLARPRVTREIKRLKDIRRKALLINEEDVLERYMRIAFADITDYVSFGCAAIPTGDVDENGQPVTTAVNSVRLKNSDQVDGTLVSEVRQGSSAGVKLADRMKALEWLGRYFELNPMDRHKKAYDNAKLALDRRKAEGGSEAGAAPVIVDNLEEDDG